MAVEHRILSVDLAEMRVEGTAAERTITWNAAVFDAETDIGGWFREKVSRGAFKKTIQEGDIRALFNHDPNFVLGRNVAGTLALRESRDGLEAVVTPPDTQFAQDLIKSVERGDISQGSFGFEVVKDAWDHSEEKSLRTLQEVRLYDVSLVTYPAYPQTDGATVRSVMSSVGVDIDALMALAAKLKAGQPLSADERAAIQGIPDALLRLQVTEPEPPLIDLSHYRNRLRLLELQGKAI